MEQKTALITGGSRGIGAATARRLAQAGYAVAIHYHSAQREALALVEELTTAGARAIAVQADVGNPQEVADMVDNVLENFCQLDILVCNAGVAWQGLLSDMTDADWRRVFATDVDGVFHCCRAVYPAMVARKARRIITVSSMWGRVGASCEVGYSAAKAAVIGLTKALAKELGPSGVTVNCVAPGVIDTDMIGNLTPEDLAALAEETPLGRIGQPSDVAEAICYLSSPAAAFVTGQVLGVDGGFLL